jgi:hypothetical protein
LDPVKIIIFLAAFALLLVLGRMLSSASEVHAAELPHPGALGSAPAIAEEGGDSEEQEGAALTGAEIAFPIQIPPVTRMDDGRYNRPNFLNYYFSKTDLVRGPDDPTCFFDELTVEAQDPESEHIWNYVFTVATPSGLRRVMEEEKFASLYLDGSAVIVPRWDLPMVLHTVVDEIVKKYRHKEVKEEEEEPPARNPKA